MALERFFDIYPTRLNFFDRFYTAAAEMRQLEQEMNLMRHRMFQLVPHDCFEAAAPMSAAASVHLQPFAPIVSEDGQTKLKLQFDVKEFKPEEVKVKIVGKNTLQVCAEHQEKAEDGTEVKKRLFVRQYQLPKGVEVEHLKPSMTKDGVLTIEAPAPSLAPAERLIPVEYKGDDASQQ